jgi:hypothetical protein
MGESVGDGRPSGSSLIAELLNEREQQAPRPGPAPAARAPHSGRTGLTGLIAAVVTVGVLLGGGVGVFMATTNVGLPSKTRFITKADAICGPANRPVATLVRPTSYPELTTAAGTLVTATDTQLTQLRTVKLPGGAGQGQAGAVFEALSSTNQAAHSLLDVAGRKDDAATAAATQRISAQYGDAGTKAKAFGFRACAVGMQAGVDNLVGGSKALIKTGFVAKADGLCREASRKLAAIASPKKNDARDISRFLNQIAPLVVKLLADLKTLPVPPGDDATVAEMLTAQEKVNANIVELRDAVTAGDPSRFAAADQESSPLGTAADAKFDAYGLGICGSNFGNS